MKIAILGMGCAKCHNLTENAEAAAKELGVPYLMEKVTDLTEITKYGVLMTPALVVDGKVKAVGRVPSVEEIKGMLA